MATTQCTECDETIELAGRTRIGQKVVCPNCAARLEIVSITPLELDLAQEDDEDWEEGEELEDFEEDDELDEDEEGEFDLLEDEKITLDDELDEDELDDFEEDDEEDEFDDFDDDDLDDDDNGWD